METNLTLSEEKLVRFMAVLLAAGVFLPLFGLGIVALACLGLTFCFACAYIIWSGRAPVAQIVTLGLLLLLVVVEFARGFLASELMVVFGCLLIGILLPKTAIFERQLARTIVVMATIFGIATFVSIVSGTQSYRTTAFGANPIWASWLLGCGLISVSWMDTSMRIKLACSVLFLMAMVASASRMPLGASLLMVLMIYRRKFSTSQLVLASLAIIGTVALLPLDRLFEAGFNDVIRAAMWQTGYEDILKNPNGYGMDQYFYLYWDYPHNLLVEFAHAYGVVMAGVLLLYVLIVPVIRNLMGYCALYPTMLLCFMFLCAMTSGSLISHKFLYILAGYALSCQYRDLGRLLSHPAAHRQTAMA